MPGWAPMTGAANFYRQWRRPDSNRCPQIHPARTSTCVVRCSFLTSPDHSEQRSRSASDILVSLWSSPQEPELAQICGKFSDASGELPKPALAYAARESTEVSAIKIFNRVFTWPLGQPRHAVQAIRITSIPFRPHCGFFHARHAKMREAAEPHPDILSPLRVSVGPVR